MLPRTSSGRWLMGIVLVVVALAVASVLVTILARDDLETLPEGTPERAVQDYLLALQNRRYEEAYDLLSTRLQETCTLLDFERSVSFRDESSILVRLDDVRMTETGADVFVRITQTFDVRPIPQENTFTQRYVLVQEEGAWKLRDAPWPYSGCFYRPDFPTATPTPTPTPTPSTSA